MAIGDEYSQREFFGKYLSLLGAKEKELGNILIDSTGLPNSVHFPLAAISNHNGEISSEVRLIYVIHQRTGLPIYFRHCPGNVIDVTTLARTIEELRQMGVNTKFSAWTQDTMTTRTWPSSSRTGSRSSCACARISSSTGSSSSPTGVLWRKSRTPSSTTTAMCTSQCVPCLPDGKNRAYAYIGLDVSRRNEETGKLFKRARKCSMTPDDVHEAMKNQGMLILLSSRRIARDRILPAYYCRQQIEQVFDIGKAMRTSCLSASRRRRRSGDICS